MKPANRLGLAIALGLTFAANPAAAQLAGSEWKPVVIGDVAVPADADVFVQFRADGELAGHGGCNRFFGTYTLSGDTIAFGPLGATRMACADAVMAREMRFLDALAGARRFARDRIDLTLADDAGTPLLRLRQTDAD